MLSGAHKGGKLPDMTSSSAQPRGRVFLRTGGWAWKIAVTVQLLIRFIRGYTPATLNVPPPDADPRPPDAGRPAPLRPAPTHHLVALKAVPPSDETHLLPYD